MTKPSTTPSDIDEILDDLYVSTHNGHIPVAAVGSDEEPDVLDFKQAKQAIQNLLDKAYSDGYDDCLLEHGAIFKPSKAKGAQMKDIQPEGTAPQPIADFLPAPTQIREAALCGASVSWWDGEYEGTCELPEGHQGPHYDGISCFDNEGEKVELKSRPIPPVFASVGYYKSGKLYQVRNVVLNTGNNHLVDLQPEPGVAIRVEIKS